MLFIGWHFRKLKKDHHFYLDMCIAMKLFCTAVRFMNINNISNSAILLYKTLHFSSQYHNILLMQMSSQIIIFPSWQVYISVYLSSFTIIFLAWIVMVILPLGVLMFVINTMIINRKLTKKIHWTKKHKLSRHK